MRGRATPRRASAERADSQARRRSTRHEAQHTASRRAPRPLRECMQVRESFRRSCGDRSASLAAISPKFPHGGRTARCAVNRSSRSRGPAGIHTRGNMFTRNAEGRAMPTPEPRGSAREAISEAVELDVLVSLCSWRVMFGRGLVVAVCREMLRLLGSSSWRPLFVLFVWNGAHPSSTQRSAVTRALCGTGQVVSQYTPPRAQYL